MNTQVGRNRVGRSRLLRRALTLLELVVVVAVLVVLAGMIVPLISGLSFQTNAATNATVADDVSRAVRTYYGRFDTQPNGWDSLVGTGGALFAKLHTSLLPLLQSPHDLTEQQAESLRRAGVYTLYDAVDAEPANAAHATARSVATGGKVALFSKDAVAAQKVLLDAFSLHSTHADWTNEFVVLGLGSWSSMRGTTVAEIPLIQAADPSNYYARVLCVYMIPSNTSTEVFPAVFMGCLLPDGSSRAENMEDYNHARSDDG